MVADSQKTIQNKRTRHIVSNTFVLFARVLFITIINLYSVRFVLSGLGDTDYGIFNAVSGIVLTATCLLPVFAISIQRFYSYEIGKGNLGKLPEIFSASINIITLMALVVLILLEGIGLPVVNNYMTLPADRMYAVAYIFQFAIVSFLLSLLQIPFTAAVFAHEDMNIYAIISSIDCALRFIVAILIAHAPFDKLVFYVFGYMLVSICTFLCYVTVCLKKYEECHYVKISDKSIYKSLSSFSGWTLYGAVSGTAMIQGSTIILNIFFGPIANAAFGVANNVYNALNSTSNSIVISFRPAMVKSYAEGNFGYLNELFKINNKLILYVLIAGATPLIVEMENILTWWLKNPTADMILFSRLFAIYSVCLVMHNPITTIIQSTGQISRYYLFVETINIMTLPVSWCLFKMGFSSYFIFVSIISTCIIAHVVRLICLKQVYKSFSFADYIVSLIIPGIVIATIGGVAAHLVHGCIENAIIQTGTVFVVTPLVVCIVTYLIGLSGTERKALVSFINKTIHRR